MPEIGSILRDARIRKKIDIAQVEADVKIRAKYLRALENDEFSLLPAPAYVKSFLRTYADYLGLDASMLVEEYRNRCQDENEAEQLGLSEPTAFQASRERPKRQVPRGPMPRGVVVGGVLALVVGFLFVIGLLSGGDSGEDALLPSTTETTSTASDKKRDQQDSSRKRTSASADRKTKSRVVRVEVIPTASVWVCMIDATGKARIMGRTLATGSREGPFKSKFFKVTFGNGYVELRINGTRESVKDTPNPVGYRVTSQGMKPLSEQERPTCT